MNSEFTEARPELGRPTSLAPPRPKLPTRVSRPSARRGVRLWAVTPRRVRHGKGTAR